MDFDAGMIYNSILCEKGILKEPLHFQFVLGAAGGMAATVENLVFLKSYTDTIPHGQHWVLVRACSNNVGYNSDGWSYKGRNGRQCNVFKGEMAKSNKHLVVRAANIIGKGNEVATPDEAGNIKFK